MLEKGCVHLYCGDGKGKSTAAAGLALRCTGSGNKVLFVQFFKDGSSGEIELLRRVGITTMHSNTIPGMVFQLSHTEIRTVQRDYTNLLQQAIDIAHGYDMLILDEIVSTCGYGIVPEEKLLNFLDNRPKRLEVILTGRNPSEAMKKRADYITEMKKHAHPFDKGQIARKGIEY